MIEEIHGTLNPGCRDKINIQQESFHQKMGFKFKDETSENPYLEQSFLWC